MVHRIGNQSDAVAEQAIDFFRSGTIDHGQESYTVVESLEHAVELSLRRRENVQVEVLAVELGIFTKRVTLDDKDLAGDVRRMCAERLLTRMYSDFSDEIFAAADCRFGYASAA